ncbi:MAG TPA: hypothetical protein VH414_04665 [Lichenihabitans sp.]|jgi:hypothetical protein|nr:hypothetical protein [Lichenihabitans sp.]
MGVRDAATVEDGPWRPCAEDLLVLGDGVALDDAARAELHRVAGSDPMIAIVSPRFGTATSARHLPAVTYSPLPDPRGFSIKAAVLRDFPPPAGPPDWDRYALALNRCGFRCAVANRAAASGMLPAGDVARRAERLEAEFPGAGAAAGAFLTAAPRQAERLLACLEPDVAGRLAIAFDATHVGPGHSGTAELARMLVRLATDLWRDRFDVAVVASEATFAFHFGGMTHPPRRVAPADGACFAVFIRIGQPFGWKEMDHAVRRAPVLLFFMLDTIGLDCIRLAPDELDPLWRFTLAEADGLLFNSAFTRRQFERRFGALRRDMPARASLHAIEAHEALSEPGDGDGTILVVGNAFAHKRVEATARLLAARCPGARIVALGLDPGRVPGTTGLPSGSLDDEALAGLYRAARVVVYPSVYEGFGFPVVDALRHRRPVILRRLPPFLEIAARLGDEANLHWFETDDDLVRLASSEIDWHPSPADAPDRAWTECVDDLRAVLDEALAGVDYRRVVRRIEFMRGRVAWARARRFETPDGLGEDAARVAGFAGRLAQRVVLRLAASPPGRALLRLTARMRR